MSFSRQYSGTSIPTFNSRRGSSTSFSISTNQTAPNLPGAGRTMGLLFDVAGRLIEQYANDIAARFVIGRQDPAAHLTLSVVPHEASSSRSSLSTNATASNLPGAGRTLGLAYDRGGGVLEVLLNRLAKQLGRGPDASMERIQERLFSMISAEDGAVPYVLELLRQKSFFIKECKRIMRYAQNDISSNQCAAFRSIISLCVDDSFLRILFNSLGAADVIQGMEPRIACAHADERDPLLSCSQKALISLAEVEVNTIAQKLHFLDAFMKTDVAREASFVLLRQFSSSQISFLALRHVRHFLQLNHPVAYFLLNDEYAAFTTSLTALCNLPPPALEWNCLDDVFSEILDSHIWIVGKCKTPDVVLSSWEKLLRSVFLQAHSFPKTVSLLTRLTNFEESLFSQRYINGLAVYPRLVIGASITTSIESSLQSYKSRIANMKRQTGHQQSLSDLWTNLSSDADLVAAEILWESHQEERSNLVNKVATGPRFQALCVALSNMLASSDNHLQRDAFRNVKAVLMHDRYCWDAMSSALVTAFERTRSPHIAKVQREIWDLSLKRQNELSSRTWPLLTLYRHRSLDHGRYHLSHNTPFSRHPLDKCAACQKMGIWEAWRNSDEACRDDLYAGLDDILWLEIKPEAQFNAVGHHPVLAGINGRGQQEYIAHVRVEAELNPYPWCTATDGASAVTFWDEQGEERRTNHFWVLVLRYDPIEAVKQSVDTKGGIDATGPCYWLAGDMQDETYDASEIEDDLDREVDFNGDDDESIYSDEMSVDD